MTDRGSQTDVCDWRPQSKDSSANDASGINIAGAAGRHSHHAILKRIVGGYRRYLGV